MEGERVYTGRCLALREVFQAKEAEIHSVTVYRDRAEVKRSVRVRVEAGENEIVIIGLPTCTEKNSIRVEGLSEAGVGVIITDVVYSTDIKTLQQAAEEGEGEYERLGGVVREKQKELQYLKFTKTALDQEKKLLQRFAGHLANVSNDKEGEHRYDMPGLLGGGTVGAVLQFMERYQEKLAQIDARKLEVKNRHDKLTEEVKVLQAKVDKHDPSRRKDTEVVHSVSVSLESGEPCDIQLLVSYVVSCAAWSSSYDVRVFTKDKTIKLQYYGLIKQWTGEDWENASISLSTAQPSVGGSAPKLPSRIIRFWHPTPVQFYANISISSGRGRSFDQRLYAGYDEDIMHSAMSELPSRPLGLSVPTTASEYAASATPSLAVETTQVEAGLFNTTFNISRKTTIAADKTEHKVTVALIELTPEFHYVSVPRLSPHSFLQATATNSSQYTLLAGPANIFLDNNFIAKSELSDVSAGEQFTSSLGVDQAIRITCQPVAVLHSTARGLSKNKVLTYTHAMKVKNTHQDEAKIEVSEQVPLSQDDRIKVHITEPDVKKTAVKVPFHNGYAVLNDSHNVEWHVTLKAYTELDLKLIYSVEHPPNDRVDGLPKV